jgi:hypothetical protein
MYVAFVIVFPTAPLGASWGGKRKRSDVSTEQLPACVREHCVSDEQCAAFMLWRAAAFRAWDRLLLHLKKLCC